MEPGSPRAAALIGEVLGEGAWDSFPGEVRRVLTENGPAVLAELRYVDGVMPDATALLRGVSGVRE